MYTEGKGVTQDYDEAIKWYKKAAEQGNSFAQKDLDIVLDYQEIIQLEKTAVQGDAKSQYRLGFIYWRGQGVTKDNQEAVRWWKKAAEQGDAEAQANLGTMYELGEGVAENYIEAYKWYILAGAQGYKIAEIRDTLRGKMTAQQIAEAQKLAKEFKPKINDNAILKANKTK